MKTFFFFFESFADRAHFFKGAEVTAKPGTITWINMRYAHVEKSLHRLL